jgi:glycosyltransferase involved in cell wall biosynthesis
VPQKHWDDPSELNIHRLPALLQMGNAPFLPGLSRLRGFDLIHLHAPFPFGGEQILLQSLIGHQRYVVTYHQDLILRGLMGPPAQVHNFLIGKRILAHADALMVTSLDYGRASRVGPLFKRHSHKIVEMPNGVDPVRFNPALDGDGVRREIGLKANDRVVLFVGALDRPHYFKGVDILLQSLTHIPDDDVKLVVVGEGDLRQHYMLMAKELGLDDRVIFRGQVSDEALPGHYAMSDILVLPSVTMGEAFGVVLLEAMACAKPVIASNLPGVRSVVSHGENGFLAESGNIVDLAEKIQTLLDNSPLRQEMGKCGRRTVEAKYSWDAIIPKLLKVYADAVARS